MHILLVADGRSPHTIGWLRGMTALGIETTLLSSRVLDLAQATVLEDLVGPGRVHQPDDLWNQVRPFFTVNTAVRKALRTFNRRRTSEPLAPAGPRIESPAVVRIESYAARRLGSKLNSIVATSRPDAVHALRIQYEAIAAAGARTGLPLAVSTWGQDLALMARANKFLGRCSREVLQHTDILMSDCERDAELAREWGLPSGAPAHVIPGNFGVDCDRFPDPDPGLARHLGLSDSPLVVYPRGATGYVNHQGFVLAVQSLLSEPIAASFLAVGLDSVVEPDTQVPGLFRCTGKLDHRSMLKIAASSAVTVSPSWSDGMPNSILEGMAGGSIPVCGDLEPLRELERRGAVMVWCDPSDTGSIASGIKRALQLSADPANRARNRRVITEHYSTAVALRHAEAAYRELAAKLWSRRRPGAADTDIYPGESEPCR